MLKTAKAFLQSYALVQREMILEMVREQFYKELPSRSKVICLCKKEQLEYWKNTIAVNKNFVKYLKLMLLVLFLNQMIRYYQIIL